MSAGGVTLVRGSAAGCFTFGANAVADDTVVIGDITYTFKAAPSSAYEVDVGVDADTSITNLVAAINASGNGGGEYASGTEANPYVTATADTVNDEVDLEARIAGDHINGLYLAATGTGPSAAAANFAGVSGGTDGSGAITTLLENLRNGRVATKAQTIAVIAELLDN